MSITWTANIFSLVISLIFNFGGISSTSTLDCIWSYIYLFLPFYVFSLPFKTKLDFRRITIESSYPRTHFLFICTMFFNKKFLPQRSCWLLVKFIFMNIAITNSNAFFNLLYFVFYNFHLVSSSGEKRYWFIYSDFLYLQMKIRFFSKLILKFALIHSATTQRIHNVLLFSKKIF